MLSTYLKRQQTLERYGSGPAAPHLDGFTDWLAHQGYQPPRIQVYCVASINFHAGHNNLVCVSTVSRRTRSHPLARL